MKEEKRIIIWGGWYGSRNVGDRALLLAITDMLQQTYESVRFIVLSATPSEVYRYMNTESKANIEVYRNKQDMVRVIIELYKADLFIFGGAVPFFDKFSQLIAMFGLTFFTRLFHTPYFLWSVSSQPVHSELAKIVFRFVLKRASGITYRDEHTRELFLSCGVDEQRMQKIPDSAISLESGTKMDAEALLLDTGWSSNNSRRLVALTPRILRPKDGEAETHYSPQTVAQYQHEIESFSSVLDWLWEANYQPIFVPMNTMAPDDDRNASRLIMEHALHGKHALLIDCEFSPRLASKIYSFCQGSFVARVHGSILSFNGNCPPMMYAFDAKHKGIMMALGMGNYIFYPEKFPPGDAPLMIKKLLESAVSLRKDMAANYHSLYKKSFIPQNMIRELLGS